ncbi:ATP-binding protein [Schaalia hyovaginalis]|uniref:sensor histidine kinase n=1 Tax=Schaalia hyovaginalis TaxID=29316 RepID=UPI002A75EA2E|nr:ATP-binding protein [Schaalia hyovaginalis]MDY2668427.1 ATP-binding protein [Schaalia hyovaginalis]
MPEILTLVTVALLGLLVGALGVGSYRMSQAQMAREESVEPEQQGLSADALAILTSLPTISIVVDRDASILRADAAAFAKGLVKGEGLAHAGLIALVNRVVESGLPAREEMRLPRSSMDSSGFLDFNVRVSPLPRGYSLILVEDTTVERRNEAARRDFSANVSHELKTPVGTVRLLAETIAASPEDVDAVAHFAPKLVREAERLSSLVTDIIDLSRLEAPDPLASPSLVDIDRLASVALERESTRAAASGVELIGPGGSSGAQVWGDPDMIAIAITNLLDNAIRYSPEGGRVVLSVEVEDDLVRINVVDSGIGIAEDELDRIFERFYRVDPARSRGTGGTGLGLSIVKHIASDHGGTVSVWSRRGRGSTFTLVLPEAATEDSKEPVGVAGFDAAEPEGTQEDDR